MPFRIITYLGALLLMLPVHTQAQQRYGAGEYPVNMSECNLCDSAKNLLQYYSLDAKYPLSSEALLQKANAAVAFPAGFNKTGFVTIRFIVNCKGQANCFHIYEVDEQYKKTVFPVEVTAALLQFVKKLDKWKPGKNRDGKEKDYYAYLTFKIKNGKVEHIIP